MPYSFVCEHCGQDSGIKQARVREIEIQAVTGSPTQNEFHIDLLSGGRFPARQITSLEWKAKHNMQEKLRWAQTFVEKKGNFFKVGLKDFSGKCPHCQKRQSWELRGFISIAAIAAFITGVCSTFIALFIISRIYETTGEAGLHALWLLAPLVASYAAATLWVVKQYWNIRSVKQRQKPNIRWSDVRISVTTKNAGVPDR